jgi:tRNA-dihydrouridine synthase
MEPGFHVSEAQRIDLCVRFFRLLLEDFEEREAVHKIKKIGGWFTKGIRNGAHFRQRLNHIHEAEELVRELEALKNAPGEEHDSH